MAAHAGAGPRSGTRVSYRDVLSDREFRALYLAQTTSILGDQVAQLAVAILVFDRTRSPLLAALTFAVTLLPWLLGGPLLSSLADRLPRRRVLLSCDVARAGIIVLVALPGAPLWLLSVLIFLVILLEAPFSAARAALLPDILGEGERYVVAASLGSTTSQFGQVLGFALGGTLVALFGSGGAILLDAASFGLSAALIAHGVRPRPAAAADEPAGVVGNLKTGLRAVFGDRLLRAIVLLAWVVAGCTMVPEALAVIYAAHHGGGPVTAGLLTAALPLGVIVGSLAIKRFASYTSAPLLLPLSLLTLLPLLATALDPPVPVAFLLWTLTGAGSALQIVANRVFVLNVPAHVRGRAFGIAATGLMSAQGLTALVAGWLASRYGPATTVAGVAAVGLVVLAVVAATWPRPAQAQAGSNHRAQGRPRRTRSQPDGAATQPGETAPPWRARPATRVWALNAALVVLAALLARTVVPHLAAPMQDARHLGWVPVFCLFAISDAFPLHFQFRQQARSVCLDYLGLVLGLYFLPPVTLVLVRVGASLLVGAVILRQRALRLVFNLAASAVCTEAALVVFHALLPAHPTVHVASWPAAVAATLTYELASTLGVAVVIYLFEGVWDWTETLRPLDFALSVDVVITLLAVVTAAAVAFDPRTVYVVVLFALLAIAALRGYHRLADRHAALDRLYAFTRDLGPVAARPADITPALRQLSGLLHARSLSLALLHGEPDTATVIRVVSHDAGAQVYVDEDQPLDQHSRRLLRDRQDATTTGGDPRPWRGWRPRRAAGVTDDGIAATVGSADRPVALLRADRRSGEFRRFDGTDLHLLKAAADQLATALEKGQLVEQLRRAATRDTLTGLANLNSLRTFLSEVLDAGRGAVVLLIDVSHFHDVNDTLGHDAGDAVLVEVARRLEAAASPGALPCRVGGDQFALVVAGGSSGEVARLAALAVKSRVEGAIRFADVTADVRVTVGLARAPDHGDDATTLLRRAEIAMTSAKGSATGVNEWEPSFEQHSARRLHLASALRSALADNELWVEYQPKVALGTGEVKGLEALVRWRHPSLGIVSPAEFIPLAEATGLIAALTSNVMWRSLETLRRWQDQGILVGVSVNVSARSLDDPVLVGQVAVLLTASGIDPGWLTIEITESSVMQNPARSLEALRQLRSLGVRLSIDDFGTGYSSLNYIRGLPVHEVKIDKSFVDAVDTDPANRAIIRAVVELADSLGLTTVAEGVEEASQALALEGAGVHEVQGYFYARPMTEERATEWLRARAVTSRAEAGCDMAKGWGPPSR